MKSMKLLIDILKHNFSVLLKKIYTLEKNKVNKYELIKFKKVIQSDVTEEIDEKIANANINPIFTGTFSLGRKEGSDVGDNSFAFGRDVTASGEVSYAEGNFTTASGEIQHVQGKYNVEDTESKYAHIVGNGEDNENRSNAHTLDWEGNAWYAGKLSQEGTPTENKDLVTKAYFENEITNKGYLTSVPDEYITEQELVQKGYLTSVPNEYVVRNELPTKVSQLENDSNFLTKHQDISNLVTSQYVDDKVAGLVDSAPETLDTLKELADALGNDANFSTTVANQIGERAKKSELPTKVSELENDSNFISSIPDEYVTEYDLSDYMPLTGGTVNGNLEVTGNIIADTYFRTPSMVGEGDDSTYYHRLDFGKQGTDKFDFYEYGGLYNFYMNKAAGKASATLIAKISSTESNFVGQLKEGGTRVYSPNNKPSLADLGTLVFTQGEKDKLANLFNYDDTDIDSRVQNLENLDYSRYLTSVPDEYVTETELNSKGYATEGFVTDKIAESSLGGEIILDGYVTTEELENKGYLTQVPSEYVTEQELSSKGYLTQVPSEYVTEQELSSKGYITEQAVTDKGYLTSVPDEYITEQELAQKGYLTQVPSEYVVRSELPTKVSQLENDSNFLIHQDILNLVTSQYVDDKVAGLVDSAPETLDTLKELADALGNDANFSTTVTNQIGERAKRDELPTKVSQLENDSNFISSIPSEYITEQELAQKGYLTSVPSEYVTEQELSGKGYITEQAVIQKGYLTQQDISDLASKSNDLNGLKFRKVTTAQFESMIKDSNTVYFVI